jgi:hypothetical protein
MASILLLTACAALPNQANPAAAKLDLVLRWNETVLQAIKAERTPPPLAARNLAMVHVAIFDAVNSINPAHRAYRYPQQVRGPAAAEAAAAVAAHRVVLELYPRRAATFDDALDASLAMVAADDGRASAVELGQSVAEKVLAWRRSDGATRRMRYAPELDVGVWRPTPPGLRPPLLPQWRYVVPFGGRDLADRCPPPPPARTSAEYTAAYLEVKSLGGRNSRDRTDEQTLIALFWDDSEGSVTPPGHWNRIAQEAARRRGLGMAENARLFALLNVCLADAAILCWECKFRHALWRPITAIHEADRAANPDIPADPTWESLLITPPFPSYTSGHSTFSGAAAEALAQFFGTDAVPFRIGSDGLPGVRRSYAGFWAAAEEAGRSRIYGGIHYEFDNRAGLASGKALAEHICRTLMRPAREPHETLSPAR